MLTSSDGVVQCPAPRPMTMTRRWRGDNEAAPNCPRCASPNTKFCYYNNYSLSQPRYFCKACRRYWTKGGSLRNVPVGGGCRKKRRSRSSRNLPPPSSSSSTQSSSLDHSSHSGGPNIDLAAVFANFLNNDQPSNNGSGEDTDEPTNTPSEASHESITSTTSYGFDNHNISDDVLDHEFQTTECRVPSECKQVQQGEAMQGFVGPDLAPFDHIIDDVFWSNESDLSTLTWQTGAQLHDFSSPLLPADQYEGSTNLFSSDYFSYFDITGFEGFSKP